MRVLSAIRAEQMAHPVAYRVRDVRDQGDALDFTAAQLGYELDR